MRIINEPLLDTFRVAGRCSWCGLWQVQREPHHLRARGTGNHKRLDIAINLISLGASHRLHPCHRAIEDGNVPREKVLAQVAEREGTTPELITSVCDFLLRLPKGANRGQVERAAVELTDGERELLRRTFIETVEHKHLAEAV